MTHVGFSTDTPPNFKEVPDFHTADIANPQRHPPATTHLYVPNITKELGVQPFRRVAIVEEFFDIIYNVHVGLGGRSGRHAGQKRTYRTITETYAFLPRDAVTKFLAGCNICNKIADGTRPTTPGGGVGAIGHKRSLLADDTCTDSSSGTEPQAVESMRLLDQVDGDDDQGKQPALSADLLNYYQLLRVMYEQTLAAQSSRSRSTDDGPVRTSTPESMIDLTINRSAGETFANQININIDRSVATSMTTSTTTQQIGDQQQLQPFVSTPSTTGGGDNIITINSAGMSINVSNSPGELKISCKTTPPKKRFSRGYDMKAAVVDDDDDAVAAPSNALVADNSKGKVSLRFCNDVAEEEVVLAPERNNNNDPWKSERDCWEQSMDVKKNEFGKCVELRSAKVVSECN